MADIRITNCHIHLFTNAHVPRWYPHPLVAPFRVFPRLINGVGSLLRLVGQEYYAGVVDRLGRFRQAGAQARQADVLRAVLPQYPKDTRFVALPMDMAHIGHGPVAQDLRAQHDELAELAVDPELGARIVPFATVYPHSKDSVSEARRAIETLGFRGLKIYPRLGFAPDHPALMQEIYPLLVERNLPVMTHCSRGGVQGRGMAEELADRYTDPRAVLPVLEAFPTLRLCLAHFGGSRDWRSYVDEGIDPMDPLARKKNWLASTLDLIRSGRYQGLWTDISYTLFHFQGFVPFLKVFLADDMLRGRVLFGSDYYMTRQEELSERAVSFRLRDALGEAWYRQLAETNPEVWLGERGEIRVNRQRPDQAFRKRAAMPGWTPASGWANRQATR